MNKTKMLALGTATFLLAVGPFLYYQAGRMPASNSPAVPAAKIKIGTAKNCGEIPNTIQPGTSGSMELSADYRKNRLSGSQIRVSYRDEQKNTPAERQIMPGVTVSSQGLNIKLSGNDSAIHISDNQVVWQKSF